MFERPARHPDIGLVVGDFTRLLLGSFATTAAGSLRELAGATDHEWHTAREPQFTAGSTAFKELARDRRESPPPAGVVYTGLLDREWTTPRFEQHFGTLAWMVSQTPQAWLDCIAWLRADGVCLSWDAAEDLFPPGMLDAMTELCGDLLQAFAHRNWDEALPVSLPAAQQRTRDRVNDTARPESGRLLHERFFDLAGTSPDRLALISEDVTVSRGRVAERALRVAASLRARGLSDGDPVAVCLSSPLSQIPAVLGILAAGGCYVPIGPDQPLERGERICRSAGVRLGIDDGRGQKALPSWVTRFTPREAETARPLPRPRSVASSSLAYILFTSGSTGQPKGVEITHRSAVDTVEDINERWSVGPADHGMLVSGLDFDLSVYEIFGPLMAGGAVVFPHPANSRNPHTWLDLAGDHHVTLWDSVPVLLDVLVTAAESGDRAPSSLRLVLTGGDWIGTDLPDRLHRLVPDCRFVACGGATEGTIYSNYCEIDHLDPQWPSVPYGWPLSNQRYRVMDMFGRDCPDWVTGELWIGGVGVARGYRNDPGRTAERFLERDHCRWYRTGDLGRYRPGGIMEFLGRADHQVKINGYRVELGEVEAALNSHDHVKQSVTIVTGQASQRQLVAYVMPAGKTIDISAVKEHAESRLPEYARPGHYRVLPEFPLSGNGKVDRKALASWSVPEYRSSAAEPPSTDIERALADEWAKILQHPVRSRRQSFFELGGDSLLAMKLSISMSKRFGRCLSLRKLLLSPTAAGMAALLEDGEQPPETVT
ncbi:amino acid adenylation domain-containing protein [Streptomyces sp. NPDC047017]|uniref:amino acid adenylation domain-containing protein n=1 Tax=Streptomyces sp. NPDC047017 TaxID=3155024 RepID=UPI0034066ACD